jgi:hypothetical protein
MSQIPARGVIPHDRGVDMTTQPQNVLGFGVGPRSYNSSLEKARIGRRVSARLRESCETLSLATTRFFRLVVRACTLYGRNE